MKRTQTTTRSLTVTTTHIVVAAAMTVIAGGLAFAGVPASQVGAKCGVNKLSTVKVLKCRSGLYSGADVTCYDGSKQRYRPGKCVTLNTLQSITKKSCANRCNVPPKKTPPPAEKTPTPVDTGYGYGYNPTPPPGYGYGYNANF